MTKPEQQRHSKGIPYRLSKSEEDLVDVAARFPHKNKQRLTRADQQKLKRTVQQQRKRARYIHEAVQQQLEREGLFDPPPSRKISLNISIDTLSVKRRREDVRIEKELFEVFIDVREPIPKYEPSEATDIGRRYNATPNTFELIELAARKREIGLAPWIRQAIQNRLHIEGWTDPIAGDAEPESHPE